MNLKKILAGFAAAAVAVSAMSVASFAVDFGSADGNWQQGNFVTNADLSDDDAKALVGVDTIKFNANATDLNWGWNNGAFTTNSNGQGWKQVSFGGTEAKADVTLEDVGDFTVSVPIGIADDTWFEIGWGTGCAEGVFTVASIEFIKGDDTIATWDGALKLAASEAEPEETTPEIDITIEPEVTEPEATEPVLIDLTATPVMKLDGGLRLNFSHPWGEPEDNIINWEDVEGTQVISVKFQVTGLTAKEVYQAYLDISNFDGGINYWGPTDASNANVTQTPVTIAGDGVYVATVELDVPYTITDLNFLALQTDMYFDPDVDENCPQIGFIAAAIDAPLVVEDGEVPVYPASTTYNGSLTMSDETWWSEYEVSLEELIGNLNPEDVKYIAFIADGHDFVVGYNTAEGWAQPTVSVGEPIVLDDVLIVPVPQPTDDDPDAVKEYYLKACLSAGDGVEYTLCWIASTEEIDLSEYVTGGDDKTDDTTPDVDDESIGTSTPDVVPGDDTNTTAPENTNGGATSTDTNPPTGVIFAIIPAVAAAAGVVIAKKRK